MKAIKVIVERTPTDQEVEIVQLFANGLRASQVANKTEMNKRTLEATSDRIRVKYGCKTVAELCCKFLRESLIK